MTHTTVSGDRPPLSGYVPGLDGVRGLAILMVLATHFVGDATAYTPLERLVTKLAGYGLLGVDLFFVLSGFLITGILLKAKGHPHYFRNFYARRTLRIFPLYYAVLAALLLVLPRVTTPSPLLSEVIDRQAWLWTYTSNFYIASVSTWESLTYLNHFWSLAIEEHFYLLWPLVVFTVDRLTLERICVAVVVTALGLRIGLAVSGMSELSISVLTPCRVDSLCLGGLLASVASTARGYERLVGSAPRAAWGIGAAVIVVSAWCAITNIWVPPLHQVRTTLYAGFFGALVLLSVDARNGLVWRAFQIRPLRSLGTYAYGLYVYHAILLWVFKEFEFEARLDATLGSHGLTMIVLAAAGTLVSLIVAMVSYELFEKRFLALKRFFEIPDGRHVRPIGATAHPHPALETAREN